MRHVRGSSCLLALVATGACGSGSSVGFDVHPVVYCACPSGQALASCTATYDIYIAPHDANVNRDAATISAGVKGGARGDVPQGGGFHGRYYGMLPGCGEAYELTVTLNGEETTLEIQGPQDFDIALSPSPPSVMSMPTLTWSPAHDARVKVDVSGYTKTMMTPVVYQNLASTCLSDPGTFNQFHFTQPGDATITVDRYIMLTGSGCSGIEPSAHIARMLGVSVR